MRHGKPWCETFSEPWQFLHLPAMLVPNRFKEDYLLTGPLEKTNEAYALAKIAGLEMCRHYRNQYGVLYHSAMPTNLYGPGDNYHQENSHVLPALIRRFHEAREAGQKKL
jgi:GDP-L-fucose synthase